MNDVEQEMRSYREDGRMMTDEETDYCEAMKADADAEASYEHHLRELANARPLTKAERDAEAKRLEEMPF